MKRFAINSIVLVWSGFVLFSLGSIEASAQNLLLQWTFDEPSGGAVDAIDTGAAPGANGVFGSTATRTTDTPGGVPGFAVDLTAPGLESTVNGGDPAKVDTLSQFTLTTWIKMLGDNSVNQGGSSNPRLLAKQGPGTFDGFSWNINPPNDGATTPDPNDFRLGLFVGGQDGFAFYQADDDIEGKRGQWVFLAATYDGTTPFDNFRFFVGDEIAGVSQLGSPGSSPGGTVLSTAGSADFGIGFTGAATGQDFALVGFQDDVRVYDGVLDVAQLETVRLEGITPIPEPASILLSIFVMSLGVARRSAVGRVRGATA